MSFWPNSLATWTQVVGPIATTVGLAVAWRANWRQGRNRVEDSERAQLEAARSVVSVAVLKGTRLESVIVRNNGAAPMLDVRVWFEILADNKPMMIGDYANGKLPVWYVTRQFIAAQDEYEWQGLSAKVPQPEDLFGYVTFFVAWTSSDGIHWRLRNAKDLYREPIARYIGPDSVTPTGFRPDVPRQSVALQ